jgi:sulfur carrier protein
MNPAVTTVELHVNGQPHTLPAPCTLAALIDALGHPPDGIATAVNGAFVSRAERGTRALRGGDQVACFRAIVGG